MKIAFMFPGQGAQSVGMGQDLYEKYEEVRNIYGIASEISGKDIAKISFNSTIEELSKTENTQLAIATMSLGILKILEKNNIKPEITVGLSLGEYPALISGGYLNVEDGIKLLKRRGYLMETKVAPGNYSMAIGISFAFLGVQDYTQILSPICIIGLVSFVMSLIGLIFGIQCGCGIARKLKAELWGGIILVIIGLKILVEHLFFQ